MGDSQPEQAGDPITKVDEGANATEAGEQEVQDVTEANQAEQVQSLFDVLNFLDFFVVDNDFFSWLLCCSYIVVIVYAAGTGREHCTRTRGYIYGCDSRLRHFRHSLQFA